MKIGAAGSLLPPVGAVRKNARRSEDAGFDSMWWPDHLMGWYPDSIWTPDVAAIAAHQSNPHTFFDPLPTMAVAGTETSHVRLGTAVTDAIRRPPPVLAQQFLTLHHLTEGRTVLGLGAGEVENIEPYGFSYDHQVSRLGEALEILRLLWGTEEAVDYRGEHWTLEGAALGLGPYEGTTPAIWLAAHGPRMLDLAGRFADGWLPIGLDVAAYGSGLERIQSAADASMRDMTKFEPGLFAYTVIGESHEQCHEWLKAPLVRAYALMLPAHVFERHGVAHPLGDAFYGLTDYIPNRLDRATALAAIDRIPFEVVHEFIAHGTPDDIADLAGRYHEVGMRHFVPWNLSFFADLSALRASFGLMRELVETVHDRFDQ